MTVDPRAAAGFAGAAAAYERARPGYPPALVVRVLRELGLGSESAVLDLAAGTGKLTGLLLPRVGSVVAVDPSGPMLAELSRRVASVEVREGAAEAIPLAHASVDAVFVAEAFHWFRPAQAAREIARVLAPRGGLALIWNEGLWREQDHPWLDDFDRLVRPHREAAGDFPSGDGRWRPDLEAAGLFTPLERAEVEHVHRLDAEDFVALIASWSWIANLPESRRRRVLAEVGELIQDHAPLDLRYRAAAYWTRRAD